MTRRITAITFAALLATILMLSACGTNTYMGRWIHWRQSDIDDYTRFPSRAVHAPASTFLFDKGSSPPPLDRITIGSGKEEKTVHLDDLAASSGTTALIVIRDDTILYEKYFNGYDRSSINTSFSTAKSVTSLLVGIAIDEGLIESVDDPVTRYIPELRAKDPRYDRITIRHLLDMKSGIAFRDHDLPWGDKPRAYYHPELRSVVMDREIVSDPGTEFVYNTFNPIILGIVLERVTKRACRHVAPGEAVEAARDGVRCFVESRQ